jgi:predicted transcriptional regulator of viral defense system
LIANHLRGPSYVSLETALSYWGLIPERTFEISSVCIQSSKKYHTALGRFTFQQVSLPYYAFGIQNVQISNEQTALISTPEKAICDKIILTAGINLRSRKQTALFLLEDLRMDITMLRNLDTSIMKTWLPDAPKKSSLQMLISTLEEL